MTKTLKRVPNHKIERLLAERVPFDNYNASISAELVEGVYRVFHWNTHILSYDTNTNAVDYFNFSYYSQTTSALQGRIVRSVLSRAQVEDLLNTYKAEPKRYASEIRRLKGMARIR